MHTFSTASNAALPLFKLFDSWCHASAVAPTKGQVFTTSGIFWAPVVVATRHPINKQQSAFIVFSDKLISSASGRFGLVDVAPKPASVHDAQLLGQVVKTIATSDQTCLQLQVRTTRQVGLISIASVRTGTGRVLLLSLANCCSLTRSA